MARFVYLAGMCVFLAVWVVCLKKSTDRIGPWWAFIMSNAVVPIAVLAFAATHKMPTDHKGMLLGAVAGVFGVTGFVFYLHAMPHFSGTVVAMANYLYPALAVVAFVVLGEALTLRTALGVALVLAGSFVLIRPGG